MNRTILNFILTLIGAILLSLFLPWWSVMLIAVLTSICLPLKKAAVFVVPFLAILSLWTLQSFMLSIGNDFTLASRISELLYLGGSPYTLLLVTGITGGLAAGIAAVLGKQIVLVSQK